MKINGMNVHGLKSAKEKEAVAMEYIKAAECKEAEIASSWLVEG